MEMQQKMTYGRRIYNLDDNFVLTIDEELANLNITLQKGEHKVTDGSLDIFAKNPIIHIQLVIAELKITWERLYGDKG